MHSTNNASQTMNKIMHTASNPKDSSCLTCLLRTYVVINPESALSSSGTSERYCSVN